MATLLALCTLAAALISAPTLAAGHAAPAAAADAGAASQVGTLELKSEPPGLEILIDGAKTGQRTPATLSLPAGPHQLTLPSPKPREFKDRSLTITIVAGKPTRLTVELARISG